MFTIDIGFSCIRFTLKGKNYIDINSCLVNHHHRCSIICVLIVECSNGVFIMRKNCLRIVTVGSGKTARWNVRFYRSNFTTLQLRLAIPCNINEANRYITLENRRMILALPLNYVVTSIPCHYKRWLKFCRIFFRSCFRVITKWTIHTE